MRGIFMPKGGDISMESSAAARGYLTSGQEPPCVGVLKGRMERDGIDTQEVASELAAWAEREPDVRTVVFGHDGLHYSVAVMLDPLTTENSRRAVEHVCGAAEMFNGQLTIPYPLGPELKGSFLLSEETNIVAYRRQNLRIIRV
jgi:hypothetical protein